MNAWQWPILRADVSGLALEWIDCEEAVRLYCLDRVAYPIGDVVCRLRGGVNARTGQRTQIEVHSIIATFGDTKALHRARASYATPLSNPSLFRRDGHMCLYCGETFAARDLSRDHVVPQCQGGQDVWTNVVAACKRCNTVKCGRTPEQAGMPLLAIPYEPTHVEFLLLKGRRVLADQQAFLMAQMPKGSPLRARLVRGVGCHTN